MFVFFNTGDGIFEKIRKFYFFYLKSNRVNSILGETIVMIVAFLLFRIANSTAHGSAGAGYQA